MRSPLSECQDLSHIPARRAVGDKQGPVPTADKRSPLVPKLPFGNVLVFETPFHKPPRICAVATVEVSRNSRARSQLHYQMVARVRSTSHRPVMARRRLAMTQVGLVVVGRPGETEFPGHFRSQTGVWERGVKAGD